MRIVGHQCEGQRHCGIFVEGVDSSYQARGKRTLGSAILVQRGIVVIAAIIVGPVADDIFEGGTVLDIRNSLTSRGGTVVRKRQVNRNNQPNDQYRPEHSAQLDQFIVGLLCLISHLVRIE